MVVKLSENLIINQVLSAEYTAVYRYVLSLCKSESIASDITQETFLKALKNYSQFSGKSSLYTWLCSIAKNTWLNHCKKSSRETNIDDFENTASSSNIEKSLADKDLTIHIHKILHDLSEPYKEVFMLRAYGELSFKDIAGLFSKSENWARVTYHRAKKNIIETLERNCIDYEN